MSESRDRLLRPDTTALMFSHRRSSGVGILRDEPEGSLFSPLRYNNGDGRSLLGSPLQWGNTPMIASPRGLVIGTMARTASPVALRFGSMQRRNMYGSPLVGRENIREGTARRGRGRGRNSPLPSWYPRTPLRDITAIIRAIERRRAHPFASPLQQVPSATDLNPPILGAPLEHSGSMISPNPTVAVKPCRPAVGHLPKILLGITNQAAGESDLHTPQKKLLNSIDQVEKVMMEEFQRIKKTPSAKKAEREKKVRTLMSMR